MPVATASREVRAPAAQVFGLASVASHAAQWLWNPQQLSLVASTRALPDGTEQLLLSDGDKLRDRVVVADTEGLRVELDSEHRPRRAEHSGRHLSYVLQLERGAGTTIASLSLDLVGDAPRPTPATARKWRRHLEHCLRRLAEQAEAPARGEEGAE